MARDLQSAGFGDQLRRERERRGVPVEAICAATKVPVRHILSLEAGAFRDLPGGIFRRGFLRSYLSVLGLEESSWMARFDESCQVSGVREPGDSAWVTFAENVKNSRFTPPRRAYAEFRWSQVFAVAGLFVAALLWRFRAHWSFLAHSHLLHTLKTWVDKLLFR